MSRKNKLPRKLTFCRTYIEGLMPYLNSRGYEIEIGNIQGYDMAGRIERLTEDEAIFVWSGPYRHATDDQWGPKQGVIHSEQGFLPHYTSVNFDPAGHGARSSIAGEPFRYHLPLEAKHKLRVFLERRYYITTPYKLTLPKRFWLFPLQHEADSVMVFDAPAYTRKSAELIRRISKVLPPDVTLVVKTHPRHTSRTLPGAIEASELPLMLIDSEGFEDEENNTVNQELLRRAEGMIAINSSFIFEALAYNVPVITLGRGVYSGSGLVKEVQWIDEGLFKGVPCKPERNLAFLHELCMNRQICYADFDDREIVAERWQRFEDDYVAYWGMNG